MAVSELAPIGQTDRAAAADVAADVEDAECGGGAQILRQHGKAQHAEKTDTLRAQRVTRPRLHMFEEFGVTPM